MASDRTTWQLRRCDGCQDSLDPLDGELIGARWLCEWCIQDEQRDDLAGLGPPERLEMDVGMDFGG